MPTVGKFQVSRNGFGLMGMTWKKTPPSQEQSIEAMKQALQDGSNLWNGGEFYGTPDYNSLQLLNAYFTKYPEDAEKVVLCIKGGLGADMSPDGTEEGVRRSVGNCLKLLDRKKKLDLFECARVDPKTPIETTVAALGKLVQEGQIGGISLSEVNAESIRRAAKVHPIACVEVEVSLWEDNVFKNGVADACAELKIPIIAYSPMGRGFLTGQLKSLDDIPEDDMRRHFPRFSPENFPKNLDLVHKIESLAKKKGCTPAQLALAWVRQLSDKPGMPVFIPIPGASHADRVKENMKIVDLTSEEIKEIDNVLGSFEAQGTRYPEALMKMLDG